MLQHVFSLANWMKIKMSMAKIQTGHEIFDHISNLREGSSLIIFDDTHFGALFFAAY